MCTELLIDGKMIRSLGELRACLGREPVHDARDGWHGPQTPGDRCLCGIDHEATAALLGRCVDRDDQGYRVYVPAAVPPAAAPVRDTAVQGRRQPG